MAERTNEPGGDQGRDRNRAPRESGQSGPSQFAGDYQSQGMEQNWRNDRDDDRMWSGQGRGGQASYSGGQSQNRQQFAGGSERAYFGNGGREAGQQHAQGQGYGPAGAQGYGGMGGSETYGGTTNSYGGGSQALGAQGSQGYGAQGQGRGQAGYGQERGYGSQGYDAYRELGPQSSGEHDNAHARGQERGYGSGLQNRGTSAGQGYGQGSHGYGQGSQGDYGPRWQEHGQGGHDERSRQFQGQYGQQGQHHGQDSDHYARGGLGNETIGQGRIGGYGAVAGRGGYGTDPYGGPQMGQGFGGSSGYVAGGQGYGQQYGYRDDEQSGSQFGGQQQSHRGRGPKNYARSDERIVDDINDRLTHADDIDASDIDVRCEGGKVTLEGTVDHRWMKHRAEDLADSCSGVKDVDNRITVKASRGQGGSQSTQQESGRNGGSKDALSNSTSSTSASTSTTGGKTGTGGSAH